MRQSTLQDYNPSLTAGLFTLLAAVVIAALLAIFAWHPWAPVQSSDTTTTNVVQPTPAQPQPQGT